MADLIVDRSAAGFDEGYAGYSDLSQPVEGVHGKDWITFGLELGTWTIRFNLRTANFLEGDLAAFNGRL
jgi:hypothetical protein